MHACRYYLCVVPCSGCEKPASNSMNFLQVNEDKKAWNTEKAVKNSPRVSIIYMINYMISLPRIALGIQQAQFGIISFSSDASIHFGINAQCTISGKGDRETWVWGKTQVC